MFLKCKQQSTEVARLRKDASANFLKLSLKNSIQTLEVVWVKCLLASVRR